MSEINDATATDVTTVDEKTVRKNPMPRILWCASTARSRPSTMPIGTVRNTNSTVTLKLLVNRCDVSTERYCESPTHLRGMPGNGGVR